MVGCGGSGHCRESTISFSVLVMFSCPHVVPEEREEESSDDENDEQTEPADDHPQEPSTGQRLSTDIQEPVTVNGSAGVVSQGDDAGTVSQGDDAGTKSNDVNGESKPDEVGEQEETDFKLAWEILELARIICQK